MKRIVAAIAAGAALALMPAAPARSADTTDIVPVRNALSALVSHDKAKVVAQFASDATILDEFPTFTFGTPSAWVDGFVEATRTDFTNISVSLGLPRYNYVMGTSAYVVLPATLKAKVGGSIPYSESGAFAVTLSKATGSWKISALAWAKEDERGVPPIPKTAPAVEETVRRSLDGINANNMAQTNAQYEASATFIDEFPQFVWSGADALDKYNVAFAKAIRDVKMTDLKLTPGPISYSYTDGPRVLDGKNAYIVVPITITATVKGKPYRETGHQAYGLKKVNGAWKIVTQAWIKESENFNPYK